MTLNVAAVPSLIKAIAIVHREVPDLKVCHSHQHTNNECVLIEGNIQTYKLAAQNYVHSEKQ